MREQELSAESIRYLFDYVQGRLVWKVRRGRAVPGALAGVLDSDGYRRVGINGRLYGEHRLVWLWHYGAFPLDRLDHKDRNRANNNIDNLRLATNTENQWNKTSRARSSSKWKGVSWYAPSRKWRADIRVYGKPLYLGLFENEADAAQAYNFVAAEYFGEYANLNK